MPYETVTIQSETQLRYKTKREGECAYAGIHLRVAPSQDRAVQLKTEVPSSEVPEEFVRSCLDGIQECIDAGGIIEGYPIEQIEVTLLHADFHPQDSTEEAFRRAGFSGFRDVYYKAQPTMVYD